MSVADKERAVLEWLSPLEPHERLPDKKNKCGLPLESFNLSRTAAPRSSSTIVSQGINVNLILGYFQTSITNPIIQAFFSASRHQPGGWNGWPASRNTREYSRTHASEFDSGM